MEGIRKSAWFKVIAILIVVMFAMEASAGASIINASHLRNVPQKGKNTPQQIQSSLLEQKSSQEPQRDGGYVQVGKKIKGLFDYGVEIMRLAINDGTAHGNNYDENGNLIKTKMNLLTLANIYKLIRLFKVMIVQHGTTGTPYENLPVLTSLGIESAHVGTEWQNQIWETLVKEQGDYQDLVSRMIDATIAFVNKDEKTAKKYGVPDRTDAQKKAVYVLGADKNLDKLLGKELKNILGAFSQELLGLPQDIKEKINVPTQISAEKFMDGLNTVGTAPIINAYLDNNLAMPVDKGKDFRIGFTPRYQVPDNLAVETSVRAAALLTIEKLRGKANEIEASDLSADAKKKAISDLKKQADGRAKKIFEEIINKKDTILIVRVSEGFGRDEVAESFKANDAILPKALDGKEAQVAEAIQKGADSVTVDGKVYKIENAIIDVIEGTNSFVTNAGNKDLATMKKSESGATSVIVTGQGVKSLGNCPDVYVDGIYTTVPKSRRLEFVADPLDPEATAVNPAAMHDILARIAAANEITINDMEVVLMDRPRETQRLAALRELQKKYAGLDIVTIKDGTVAHSLVATFGRKSGKHKVVITVGGAPEGFMNLAVAGAFAVEGSLASVRVYSTNVNKAADKTDAKDLAGRYNFSPEEQADIRNLRTQDAEAIIRGKKLFTQEDVQGDVVGSFAFITNNGVFNIAGAQATANNNAEVSVLRIAGINGKPAVWFETKVADTNPAFLELTTLNPKANFVYDRGPAFSPLKGRAAFEAIRKANQNLKNMLTIMCTNIRNGLSFDGIIRAAKVKKSVVIFQQAMSELGYTWPSGKGHELENAVLFANSVKEAARRNEFSDYMIKGDHITVKVDAAFLKDMKAQEIIADLFETILSTKDNEERERLFAKAEKANLSDDEAVNKNIKATFKSVRKALDLVKVEVANDYTIFALDPSFMPMELNIKISAFLAGFIPEYCAIESEHGEIGGDENTTTAQAVQFLTGIPYREEVFIKEGTKYTKLVMEGPALNVRDALEKTVDQKLAQGVIEASQKGDKVYTFAMQAEEMLKSADGLLAVQKIFNQLGAGKNIKFLLYSSDIRAEDISNFIATRINELTGDVTALSPDMFDVVSGTAQDVKTYVANKYKSDIFRVIGRAAQDFAGVPSVVMEKAADGKAALLAAALYKALDTVVQEAGPSISVVAVAIEDTTLSALNKFEATAESELRV